MDTQNSDAAGIESKDVTQPIESNNYQYQPLETPASLRFIELLAGEPSHPVEVKLHHGTLSDLPKVAAISYEWGENVRRHKVLCEGRVLKVTTNLLDLLRALRSAGETRHLWIDALCINQEDLDERSKQVPMMKDIYQKAAIVLIWIGPSIPETKQACQYCVQDLAKAYDSLAPQFHSNGARFGMLRNPSNILGGEDLAASTQEPFWDGVIDLLSRRTYFERLWIVQEIVMPTHAIVNCGEFRMAWEHFHKAAKVVFLCEFLQASVVW
jgi:hypothetical protein